MRLLAQATAKDAFGEFKPASYWENFRNPAQGISTLMITGIKVFLIVAGFTAFAFLLYGAYSWINSGGEKENIENAQKRMTNAVIGLILVIAVFTLFNLVSGDILGIIRRDAAGNWYFDLPSITQCVPLNGDCSLGTRCCSGTCKPAVAPAVGMTCQP